MTESEWMRACAAISKLWPHATVNEQAMAYWFPLLSDLDGEEVIASIHEIALRDGQRFPPGVGTIRAAVIDAGLTWMDAWLEVSDAIRGDHGRVRYQGDDEAVEEFLRGLPPWREQNEATTTLRAQFRDYWKAHRRREQREQRREVALRAVDRNELEVGDG